MKSTNTHLSATIPQVETRSRSELWNIEMEKGTKRQYSIIIKEKATNRAVTKTLSLLAPIKTTLHKPRNYSRNVQKYRIWKKNIRNVCSISRRDRFSPWKMDGRMKKVLTYKKENKQNHWKKQLVRFHPAKAVKASLRSKEESTTDQKTIIITNLV